MTSPSKDRAEADAEELVRASDILKKVDAMPSEGNCYLIAAALDTARSDGFAEGMKRAAEICDVLAERENARAVEASDSTEAFAHRCTETMARHCAGMISSKAEGR